MELIDDGDGAYEATDESVVIEHEYSRETPASIAVIQAIGALEGVDPTAVTDELGISLYEHVDPEALDAILADGSGTGDVVISFLIAEGHTYRVEIEDTGTVRIASRS
ncbi:HalOD1 output domain-containing protein [Natrialbaceae archaeon GCM10025810]|uniref:HalOD1 output domain-containing protein n=1 Tax=Halovalidus salilacus TaxID=3075124 RepID=UPI00360B4D27